MNPDNQSAPAALCHDMSTRRRGFAAHALAMVAILFAMVATPAMAQLLPLPDDDPFYKPPAGYESLSNGAVLRDRKINAQYLLPFISTDVVSQLGSAAEQYLPYFEILKNLKIDAYQVLYKSTDSHDLPTAQIATVLVPQGPWTGGGTRPLVSYQLAEDSTATRCAPSYTLRNGLLSAGVGSNATFEVALSLPALAMGYAIVYSDYEGPRSHWLAGKQAAHGVLDGIRAVLAYTPAGLSRNTQVGLAGYSGGGGAGGWAAQLAESYAPELNVVGAAVGAASNSDLVQVYNRSNGIAGTATSGVLVLAVAGLNRAFPEAGIDAYLNPVGKALVADAGDKCFIEGLLKYPLAGRMENYTIAPWIPLPESAPGKKIFGPNSLVGKPPVTSFPILNYHDEFDELVPVKASNDLALGYCRAGVPVQVMRTATPVPLIGLVHIAGEAIGGLPALNFLANRFKGLPARNDCPSAAIWSSPLPIPYKPLQVQ